MKELGIPKQDPSVFYRTQYLANGGNMMRPRRIKEVQRDGHTVQKIDSQVAVESIARP